MNLPLQEIHQLLATTEIEFQEYLKEKVFQYISLLKILVIMLKNMVQLEKNQNLVKKVTIHI